NPGEIYLGASRAYAMGGTARRTLMCRCRTAACAAAVLLLGLAGPRPRAAQIDRARPRPIDFIANDGQWDRRIDFALRQGPMSATIEGPTLRVGVATSPATHLSLSFDGASPAVRPTGDL